MNAKFEELITGFESDEETVVSNKKYPHGFHMSINGVKCNFEGNSGIKPGSGDYYKIDIPIKLKKVQFEYKISNNQIGRQWGRKYK